MKKVLAVFKINDKEHIIEKCPLEDETEAYVEADDDEEDSNCISEEKTEEAHGEESHDEEPHNIAIECDELYEEYENYEYCDYNCAGDYD